MIQAYLDKKAEARNIGLLITVMMVGACFMGLIVAAMVAWGWMPLGERDNIPRWSGGLNTYENDRYRRKSRLCALRRANSLRLVYPRTASLRWSQWMFFVSLVLGGVILLSVIIPVGLKFSLLLGQNFDIRGQINNELVAWRPPR